MIMILQTINIGFVLIFTDVRFLQEQELDTHWYIASGS